MLRKLLALLVLVTGLAAANQPAHAVQIEVESVRTALDTGYVCAAQIGQMAAQAPALVQRDEIQPKMCPRPPRVVLIVPAVMLQADRAHE